MRFVGRRISSSRVASPDTCKLHSSSREQTSTLRSSASYFIFVRTFFSFREVLRTISQGSGADSVSPEIRLQRLELDLFHCILGNSDNLYWFPRFEYDKHFTICTTLVVRTSAACAGVQAQLDPRISTTVQPADTAQPTAEFVYRATSYNFREFVHAPSSPYATSSLLEQYYVPY